jgi:hypothetical protein
MAWMAKQRPEAGVTKAALQKNAKWQSGDRITVAFLEGEKDLRRRVQQVAKEWTKPGMANLRIDFVDGADALVRIAFMQGEGSWSTVGTTCKQVKRGDPTMNYGWLHAGSTDEEVRSVVLHEFGHALGLIHEHQSPAAGIKWNRDAVIRELSQPPNSWSVEEIEFNVLKPLTENETNHTTFDPKSIMVYPVPASWTMDGFSTGENGTLSDRDQRFIREQYT